MPPPPLQCEGVRAVSIAKKRNPKDKVGASASPLCVRALITPAAIPPLAAIPPPAAQSASMSMGFGFVEFKSEELAKRAMKRCVTLRCCAVAHAHHIAAAKAARRGAGRACAVPEVLGEEAGRVRRRRGHRRPQAQQGAGHERAAQGGGRLQGDGEERTLRGHANGAARAVWHVWPGVHSCCSCAAVPCFAHPCCPRHTAQEPAFAAQVRRWAPRLCFCGVPDASGGQERV